MVILRSTSFLFVATLAACNSTTTVQSTFLDPAKTGTVSLAASSLDSTARATSALTGNFNRDTDSFDFGTLTGTIDTQRSTVTLDAGGQVVLAERSGNQYAAFFDATPTSGNRTIGVVGVPTATANLPSGSASYSGTANVVIQDGADVYELTGTSTIDANFGAGTVATDIDALSGTKQTGANAPSNVSDVANVTFSGATISGATFNGGTVGLQSSSVSSLSGNQTSAQDGTFFGPDADEAGAVFAIDDSTNGTVTVLGTVLAD